MLKIEPCWRAVDAQNGDVESQTGALGTVDYWSQIRITLMRSIIRIRSQVKIWIWIRIKVRIRSHAKDIFSICLILRKISIL
jgi:hypothetical protein